MNVVQKAFAYIAKLHIWKTMPFVKNTWKSETTEEKQKSRAIYAHAAHLKDFQIRLSAPGAKKEHPKTTKPAMKNSKKTTYASTAWSQVFLEKLAVHRAPKKPKKTKQFAEQKDYQLACAKFAAFSHWLAKASHANLVISRPSLMTTLAIDLTPKN